MTRKLADIINSDSWRAIKDVIGGNIVHQTENTAIFDRGDDYPVLMAYSNGVNAQAQGDMAVITIDVGAAKEELYVGIPVDKDAGAIMQLVLSLKEIDENQYPIAANLFGDKLSFDTQMVGQGTFGPQIIPSITSGIYKLLEEEIVMDEYKRLGESILNKVIDSEKLEDAEKKHLEFVMTKLTDVVKQTAQNSQEIVDYLVPLSKRVLMKMKKEGSEEYSSAIMRKFSVEEIVQDLDGFEGYLDSTKQAVSKMNYFASLELFQKVALNGEDMPINDEKLEKGVKTADYILKQIEYDYGDVFEIQKKDCGYVLTDKAEPGFNIMVDVLPESKNYRIGNTLVSGHMTNGINFAEYLPFAQSPQAQQALQDIALNYSTPEFELVNIKEEAKAIDGSYGKEAIYEVLAQHLDAMIEQTDEKHRATLEQLQALVNLPTM